MAYTKYSLTPANNTAAPPDGAPEGMLPSAVNDTMRDMMAQIRDVGDGIRDGTYTMTAAKITGGSITGVTFSSSAATITGGTITGITDLAVADGGTGASTAAGARTNLGLDGFVNMKNRIINGAMVIDQRNAGASVTPTTDTYTLDRWQIATNVSSKVSVQQSSTAPTGFTNSTLITSLSAYTIGAGELCVFRQPIEGYNVADLGLGTANAKTFTVSFWVRSSLTGTFGGALTNGAENRSYPFTYTISAANTFEQKTITVAGDTTGTWLTTNGAGLKLVFGLGVGSTFSGTAGSWSANAYFSATGATSVVGTNGATFYITGVQLEVGSTATSFDYRPYGTELQLCQRYLPAFTGANGATTGAIGTGGFYSTTEAATGIPFPVPTRVAPTGISVSSASHFQIDGLTSAACTSATFSSTSQNMGGINFGYATSTTSGSFARLRFNNASGLLLFTGCEL